MMDRFRGAQIVLALGVLRAVFGCTLDYSVGSVDAGDRGAGGGSGGLPPSCAVPKRCNGTDCCASGLVAGGGPFYRDGAPQYPATVSDFRLDIFEVTVGRFRVFVEAGKGTRADPPAVGDGERPGMPRSGWLQEYNDKLVPDVAAMRAAFKCDGGVIETWTPSPATQENLPMNCLTWYEAFAFCVWDGGWLPTSAEWYYAASGGVEQRPWPWGIDAIDPSRATYGCGSDCKLVDLPPVGSKSPKGDGKWRQSDLSGSLWEWTLDTEGGYPTPCIDCANLTNSPNRVRHGGNLKSSENELAPGAFSYTPATERSYGHGVRCARRK
ncbi:formylglycine-generating enzyme family protein [Pendulispora albinea]|uniref:Formylglycine-generating enzyme family protein n=1 Tax=Pendulispora albinea TaxID=2741071 RepID=A0ABZ2M832_9BACT